MEKEQVEMENIHPMQQVENMQQVGSPPQFEAPKKSSLDFAFKFIKQSIMTALEETENTLNSLSWLEERENIPSNISEQDILIMEETAQVRTKVARQLLKSLRSYKPRTEPPGQEVREKEGGEGGVEGMSPRPLSLHKYYRCKLCKARFHKQSHLKCHIRLSHYKLSFVCTKCHNHFPSRQRLKHHRCPVGEHAQQHVRGEHAQHVQEEQEEQEEQVVEDVVEMEEEMEPEEEPEEMRGEMREVSPEPPIHAYHPAPIHEPLPHHGVPVNVAHLKYNGEEEEEEARRLPPRHETILHPEVPIISSHGPKIKSSPCQSITSAGSSRSAHSSNEDHDSPKPRERTSSCTPGTSPEDNEDQMRDYRNGNMPAVTPNLVRAPNLAYMPEVNYYMKDSPPDPSRDLSRERSFFQDRRHLPLPPIPLHRFDTAFGNPLPSIIPRPGQSAPDIRAQYENGNLSNLPSPIPTTQPLQSFIGKKEIPLLNIQKNNAFISQLIAASCIPTPSSTSNVFTSQTTPSSGNTFDTTESGSSSTTPPQEYPPPPPPPIKAGGGSGAPHAGSSSEAAGDGSGNLNQFLDYKKYSCKICHRKFSQRSSLNRHVYTIHWNMKIKCAFCTKTYTQKCLLKQHVYEEHGVEACLQMFSANERINWKMQLVNSQKQRLNMAIDENEEGKSLKQEASSS